MRGRHETTVAVACRAGMETVPRGGAFVADRLFAGLPFSTILWRGGNLFACRSKPSQTPRGTACAALVIDDVNRVTFHT